MAPEQWRLAPVDGVHHVSPVAGLSLAASLGLTDLPYRGVTKTSVYSHCHFNLAASCPISRDLYTSSSLWSGLLV